MNLTSAIEMPRAKAREAFVEYRDAVRDKRRSPSPVEDRALMDTYRALSRGERLIRLSEVIANGGTTILTVPDARWETGGRADVDVELPQLAVARADTEYVWCGGVNSQGGVTMVTKVDRAENNQRDVFQRANVFGPSERTALRTPSRNTYGPRPRAMVPIIPPRLRPKRTRIAEFHILFEAEWAIHVPPAPIDPALLRHIGGDIYAVVATWDLTPIERAVLAVTR